MHKVIFKSIRLSNAYLSLKIILFPKNENEVFLFPHSQNVSSEIFPPILSAVFTNPSM